MMIYGPYKDLKKEAAAKLANEKLRRGKASGQTGRKRKPRKPKIWYLVYSAPVVGKDGTMVLDAQGSPVLQRHRPYYKTQDAASADKDRILRQHSVTGSGEFLFDRRAANDYEEAKKIVGEKVSLHETARFWRLHHPVERERKIVELVEDFLTTRRALLDPKQKIKRIRDLGRHYGDLASRCRTFGKSSLGARYPKTITRSDILAYLLGAADSPRTVLNHKRSLRTYFGWLLKKELIDRNPVESIGKDDLPKIIRKRIQFLGLEQAERYLRTLERYDPELVAHEIVQLFAGVRADDEMADFDAELVHVEERSIELPADVAKTEERDVIDKSLIEPAFWVWWRQYGPKKGILRPKNYGPRFDRIRILSFVDGLADVDHLATLPIKTLKALPEAMAALAKWPFNARRRSFCTYHVAKYQSADKTALILRHQGSAATLHKSYRGRGVTRDQGKAYFAILPQPVDRPIRPEYTPRGIVKIIAERSAAATC